MDLLQYKRLRLFGMPLNSVGCKCFSLVAILLAVRALVFPEFFGSGVLGRSKFMSMPSFNIDFNVQKQKFLEVPQIVWGMNNQKIAFARACLTARLLNRTLLMPSLSASLFYKEVDLLQPVSFDKVFQFEKFNALCEGFVKLGRYSDVSNRSDVVELPKGSGRRWTVEKDLDQLRQCSEPPYDEYETIRIVGKNPFLWHDHWSVKDYAKIFECLVLVEELLEEADKVVAKIREVGQQERRERKLPFLDHVPYVAVHMRIEKDWMIHCKKLEQRLNISEICSSKEQILDRVGNIKGLSSPVVVYLAVADSLLEDNTILSGWKEGLLPFEKKRLGVLEIYKRHPYLFQSAIDYEVCLRSDVFVGNSFSTFSSLVVLDRTQRLINLGASNHCGIDIRWPSYAYNIQGDLEGPQSWATNMSDTSLQTISYGRNFCYALYPAYESHHPPTPDTTVQGLQYLKVIEVPLSLS